MAVSEQAAPVTNNMNVAAKQEEPFSRVPPCVYVFVYRLDRSVPAENPLVTLVGPGSLFNDDPFTGVVPPSEAACNSLASLANDNAKRSPEASKG